MICVAVAVFVVAAGSAADAPIGGGAPLLTREEPHLAAGRRAVVAGAADVAIERFRGAVAKSDDERAIVEYDVAQALVARGVADAEAAAEAAKASGGAAGAAGGAEAAAAPPQLDDAIEAFERAAELARHPLIVSEARLAAGTSALMAQKLDDAIAQLRKSLVADPKNERARRNLQRALMLKAAQPPPPPQDGDGDGDGKKDQKDQQDQGDKQNKDDQEKDQQKDQGQAQQDQQDQQDQQGKKPQDQQGDDDDKPQPDGKAKNKDDPSNDKKDGTDDATGKADAGKNADDAGDATPAPKKPTSKEEARRLLEGIRSRERPLSPLEMRGVEAKPAEPGGNEW